MKLKQPVSLACLWACLLFGLALPLAAQDDKAEEKETPQVEEIETFKQLKKLYTEAQRDFSKRMRDAEPEKRMKIYRERPTLDPYRDKLIEFVDADPKSEEALEIMDWWAMNGRASADQMAIIDRMLEHHSESEKLATYVERMPYFYTGEEGEAKLRDLIENNSQKAVKGTATYALHDMLSKSVASAKGEKADDIKEEMKTLFDSVMNEYADLEDGRGVKFSARLEAIAFAEKLEIGKPVPDILGTDLDGVEFKLSDYRGKVTVIDFWGDW